MVAWDRARVCEIIARGSANPTIAIAAIDDLKTMFEDSPQTVVEIEEYVDLGVINYLVGTLRDYPKNEIIVQIGSQLLLFLINKGKGPVKARRAAMDAGALKILRNIKNIHGSYATNTWTKTCIDALISIEAGEML